MVLEATPERVASAKRASGRDWTFGPDGPVELGRNPVLAEMVTLGLIRLHYVAPQRQIAGRNDFFRLTDLGAEWLTRAEQESQR